MNGLPPELINAAVQTVVAQAQALGLSWNFRMATVVANSGASGLTIVFDGDTAVIAAINITGFPVANGDRVYALMIPTLGNYVIGQTRVAGGTVIYINSGFNGSTASGSFSNLPNSPTLTLVVAQDAAVLITIQTSCYTDSANTSVQFGFSVNGTDYTAVNFAFNQANVHHQMGGQRIARNLKAGITTITARWLRSGGGGNIISNNSDWVSFSAQTVIPG